MKNVFKFATLALVLGVSAEALANPNMGGFTGPSQVHPATTIAEAKKLSDDTAVVLTGKIEKALGDEKYLFTDNTGSVTVEIDDEDWRGLTVNEKDTVEIRGEVDKDLISFEIDVDSVAKK